MWISEDKIDEKFEEGLFYLDKREHIIIKKALAYYLQEKKYKTQKEYDDFLFLYGDLNRTEETQDIDIVWG